MEEDSIYIELEPFNPEESNLAGIGYESIDIVGNLETLYLVILYFLFLLISLVLLWLLRKVKYVNKLYYKLKNFLLWGPIIRLFQEGYLEFAVVCFINLKFSSLLESSLHNSISMWMTRVMQVILVIFPLFIIIFLSWISEDELMKDKVLLHQYGELFKGLKI